MNKLALFIISIILFASCTSQKKLAYLQNLPIPGGVETFTTDIPEYYIQYRDILYVTIKAMSPDGTIRDFLSPAGGNSLAGNTQNEAGQYLSGYEVASDGNILLPVIGAIRVAGSTLNETRSIIQRAADSQFNNTTVECKLLSFKFTVIGEVKMPGTYFNYNNYLTVFEAIGRAGGVGDFGKRDKVLVIRSFEKGSKTYTLNLQDKAIINSEAYYLLPNDVVIVEPEKHKIFNLNLPTISFIVTSITSVITTTLLLINYFE